MFGKPGRGMGDVIRALVIIAVIACLTGVFSGGNAIKPEVGGMTVAGLAIMIAAACAVCLAPLLAKKVSAEKAESATMFIKLGGLALCAAGAIMVFCG